MDNPQFSLVIPTTNRVSTLKRLLSTIRDQNGVGFEVIVIEDSDEMSKATFLKSFAPMMIKHLHTSGKKGANFARNLGLTESTGKYVFFLDDDTYLPDDNFLYRLFNTIDISNSPMLVGGYYLTPINSTLSQWIYNSTCNLWVDRNWIQNNPILLGGNFLIRKEDIAPTIRFDEKVSFGGDETDFHKQWLKAYPKNHPFIHEAFSIYHDSRLSWTAMALNSRRQQENNPTSLDTIVSFFRSPSKKVWLYLPTLIYILAGKFEIFKSRK